MKLSLKAAAGAATLALLSLSAQAKDASIAFADHGGIHDWQADRDVGMWVQDSHLKWYYARFMSPCLGLRFAEGVGFVTGPGGNLDRFGAVKVRGEQRCVFTSFEASPGPPKPKAKGKAQPKADPKAAK